MHAGPRPLVGVDSDGCVFDTMAPKQVRCFHPAIIEWWGLEPVERDLRAVAEFVNLHSRGRGRNRFVALVETFERLAERPAVQKAGVRMPDLSALRALVNAGGPPDHEALRRAVERTGDPELRRVLDWSLGVNARIARMGMRPPFPGAREALEYMAPAAEVVVVSQTPAEALVREWRTHGLDGLVASIGGQEQGDKARQLGLAMRGRPGARTLMIGDAPGDLDAARKAGGCFYPIMPGAETASWHRLRGEAFDRFLQGAYRGAYEDALVAGFDREFSEEPSPAA